LSLYCSVVLCSLHSFPTRRSSDLLYCRYSPGVTFFLAFEKVLQGILVVVILVSARDYSISVHRLERATGSVYRLCRRRCVYGDRSEEHTSELQSRFDLVCRLLLEK